MFGEANYLESNWTKEMYGDKEGKLVRIFLKKEKEKEKLIPITYGFKS